MTNIIISISSSLTACLTGSASFTDPITFLRLQRVRFDKGRFWGLLPLQFFDVLLRQSNRSCLHLNCSEAWFCDEKSPQDAFFRSLSTGGRKFVPGYVAADFTSCSKRGASLCSSFSTV